MKDKKGHTYDVENLLSKINSTKKIYNFYLVKKILGIVLFTKGGQKLDKFLLEKSKSKLKSNDNIFFQLLTEYLSLNTIVNNENNLERIPKKGATLLVANHQNGALEGIALTNLVLKKIRKDVKIVVNLALSMNENVEEFIFVDPSKQNSSIRYNIKRIKEISDYFKKGYLVIIFPSGMGPEYSIRYRAVVEQRWNKFISYLTKKQQVDVIPVFCYTNFTKVYKYISYFRSLKKFFFFREMFNPKNRNIEIEIGSSIQNNEIISLSDEQEIADYYRLRSLSLERTKEEKTRRKVSFNNISLNKNRSSLYKNNIEQEILAIPIEDILIQDNLGFNVFLVRKEQILYTMQEIGILREQSYQGVGLTTGKEIDIDKYDDYYRHLILWDNSCKEVAGSYRVALSDEILENHGINGFYSSLIIDYKAPFFEKIGHSIELGRSFISPKYQKSFQGLLLLLKGLSIFVVRNPKYRTLFGGVTINNQYSVIAKELIIYYLQKVHHSDELSKVARGKSPFEIRDINKFDLSYNEKIIKNRKLIGTLLTDIDGNQVKMPTLLKQYLNLGAVCFSYNIDKNFANDCKIEIVVDLTKKIPYIDRFFPTKKDRENYLLYHS